MRRTRCVTIKVSSERFPTALSAIVVNQQDDTEREARKREATWDVLPMPTCARPRGPWRMRRREAGQWVTAP